MSDPYQIGIITRETINEYFIKTGRQKKKSLVNSNFLLLASFLFLFVNKYLDIFCHPHVLLQFLKVLKLLPCICFEKVVSAAPVSMCRMLRPMRKVYLRILFFTTVFVYAEFSSKISFVWLMTNILEVQCHLQSVPFHILPIHNSFWSRGGADTASGSSESTHETATKVSVHATGFQSCKMNLMYIKGKGLQKVQFKYYWIKHTVLLEIQVYFLYKNSFSL